jgi:Fe-S oxidoreductase
MSESIRYQHISTFLADRLDRLPFIHPLSKTVTIHDSCHLGRGLGEYEAPRKILSRIPGVNVVEMSNTKENAVCCGAGASFFDPQSTDDLIRQRLDEAKKCGADVLATLCISCQTSLRIGESSHCLTVSFLTDLIGEAMGIRYEDKFKNLVALGTIDEMIDAASENIEANGFTVEEMQTILPHILGME